MELRECDEKTKELFYGVKANNISQVQRALQKGAKVNALILSEKIPRSALHFSAQWGFPEIISCLVAAGADIEFQWKGFTPVIL